ncbi:hypothetical protein [Haloimpatiens massiliensis]|uniref:hypothetical protein n=1 Tax=Haloimpatiens massiliensis TaxID=1658110 RepID=UPI0015E0C2C0|nr:hypothetical protein [Haloimpatiens massiliensis]
MGIINIKDLSKEYIYRKNINKALNKVSMQINEGEIVATRKSFSLRYNLFLAVPQGS